MSSRIIKPAIIENDGDLELNVQDNIISEPLAALGIRNIGKSYLVGKICEQLCEIKQPFIVVDPEGEYWTLKEHYPVIVAAVGKPVGRPKGYKADLVVTEESALVLARRIAEKGYSVILDLRNASMAEGYEVLGSFLEALYQAEGQYNRPLILIMEEAHVLVPEVGRVRLREIREAQNKVIYWTFEIAARGRHRGLGYICIARRAAEVAKGVLSQCPTRIIFKLVDPADIAWLKDSGFSKEQIDTIQALPQGKAFAIGLADKPLYIMSKARTCTHGGKTPIAMAVETPELEHAVADLSKLIKAPPAPPGVPEEVLKKLETVEEAKKRLETKLNELTSSYEARIKELEADRLDRDRKVLELTSLNENLKRRIQELERQVFTAEERTKLTEKIQSLESEVKDLRKQLAEAQELEAVFERLRELMDKQKEIWIQQAGLVGVELVPKDIQALKEERDRLKTELETYRREEDLRKELFQQTLEDPNIRSWMRDAERFLLDLKRRGQAGGIVLKAAMRMDPETSFLAEEIQSGYTADTNQRYLKLFANKGLLWEVSIKGRMGFRNRLPLWVAENIRKIRPNAPDGAIDEIVDRLKKSVIGG